METARISNYEIVKIIKTRTKTSIVQEISTLRAENQIVKNTELKEDPFVPLTAENAPDAILILNIEHPEWGVKRFNYRSQALHDGMYGHTWSSGSDSTLLFEGEFEFWRVIK